MLYLINEGVNDPEGNPYIRVRKISELEVPLYTDTVYEFDNNTDPARAQDISTKPDDYFIEYEYNPPANDEDIPTVKSKKLMHRIRDSDGNIVGTEEVTPPQAAGGIPISKLKIQWHYINKLSVWKHYLSGGQVSPGSPFEAELISTPDGASASNPTEGWSVFKIPNGQYTKNTIYKCNFNSANAYGDAMLHDNYVLCASIGHQANVGDPNRGGVPNSEIDWSIPIKNIFPQVRYYDNHIGHLLLNGIVSNKWYRSTTAGYLGHNAQNITFAYTADANPNDTDPFKDMYFRIKRYSILFE